MGNCLNVKRSSSIRVHHEENITPDQAEKKMNGHDHHQMKLKQWSDDHQGTRELKNKSDGAKKVSFKVGDNNDDDRGNVVRCRIVLTQQELSEVILACKNKDLKFKRSSSSIEVEKLLMNALKVRRKSGMIKIVKARRVNWKPCLESIPEEQHY